MPECVCNVAGSEYSCGVQSSKPDMWQRQNGQIISKDKKSRLHLSRKNHSEELGTSNEKFSHSFLPEPGIVHLDPLRFHFRQLQLKVGLHLLGIVKWATPNKVQITAGWSIIADMFYAWKKWMWQWKTSVLLPRDACAERGYEIPCRPSACPSVWPSVWDDQVL